MLAHNTWGELWTIAVIGWAQFTIAMCLGMILMWGLMKGYSRR